MSIIKLKRGGTGPTGLTLGEPAWDYANNKLFVGVTSSAVWIGGEVDNSTSLGTSQIKIPTQYAVKTYVDGAVTGSVSGVASFNGATGAIAVTGGRQLGITQNGNQFTFRVIDGATSELNAGALYGVSGAIYASNLATGLLYGGIITINAGNSAAFDITAGRGQIHLVGATWNSGPAPTLTYINWSAQTGITLSGITSADTTWLYFDNTGTLQQKSSYYTDAQIDQNIIIGALVHPTRSYISLAKTIPNVGFATDKQYEQFIRLFGPLKQSGHTIAANGANLKLNRSSGSAFVLGRNWINDPNNPTVVTDNAQTDCTFWRYYRGATAGTFVTVLNQTAIDPDQYDNGSGTLQPVPSNQQFTIQRLFYFPGTPSVLGVYYGRGTYASMPDAAANIQFEDFTEIDNTKTNAISAGYIIVKKGTTNLTTAIAADECRIIQSGIFRSTVSGGGSIATKLDDLTDVTISGITDNETLIYDIVSSQWLNTPIEHIAVSSYNGRTGAVQGVSAAAAGTGISVSGATGAVTITNTGILSFNGSTGAIEGVAGLVAGTNISISGATGNVTITNTGVRSINGVTGTITNVARLNEGNTFSVRQVMNAGITSANLYVSGGVTFTGSSTYLNSTTTTVQNSAGLLTVTSSISPPSSTLRLVGNDGDIGSYNSNIIPGVGVDGVALTHTLPSSSGTLLNTNFNSYVSTYNGRTGAVQGVSAASAGSGISVSGSTGAITITNTGVTGIVAGTGISVSGSTGNVAITNTGVQSFNGSTGAVAFNSYVSSFNGSTGAITGVSSVNGFTGAVSITYAAAITITSTNSASTFYPALSLGAGNTALYVDNVTTPLSYVPSTGTLTVKSASMTTGPLNTTIIPGTITLTDGTDVASVTNIGFDHNGSVNFSLASNVGVLVGGNFSIGDYAQSSYQLNFPTSAGSNGQVLTTDGAYPATLSWSTPAGGSPSTTTQTIDFSETTNNLSFTISGVNTSNKVYSMNYIVGKTASLQNADGSIVVVGTVESATTYWDGTRVGDGTTGSAIHPFRRNADIVLSPPFTSGYTAGYLLGLTLTVFGDNNIYTRLRGSGISADGGFTAGLTFGGGITYPLTGLALSHTENTYVTKTITGQSWVTTDKFITCKCLGLTTADHTPEDAILEGVKFEINNIVAGVGFDIIGHAPEGTYGKYQIKCLGQ